MSIKIARSGTSTVLKRRRFTAAAVATGAAGSLAIALSMGASLSSLTATITNSQNTAATAALAITETGTTNATGTCNSYDATATCSSINKYGGTGTPLVPGGSQTQVVTFTNSGSVAVGSATLKGGVCTASTVSGLSGATTPTTPNTTAGNLCSVLQVQIFKGTTSGTSLYNGSLSGYETATAASLGTLAVGASQVYTFVVSLPSSATTAVQGQSVLQPMTWTFNQ